MPRPPKDDALYIRKRIAEEDARIEKLMRQRLALVHAYAVFGGRTAELEQPSWRGVPAAPNPESVEAIASFMDQVGKS